MDAFAVYSISMQIEKLAEKLTSTTGIPNKHFEVGSLMLRNCSFSEDGAQEYEVYKQGEDGWYMFESLTVSWMNTWTLKNLLATYETKRIEDMVNPISDKPLLLKPMRKVSFEEWETYKKRFAGFEKSY